MGVVESDLGVKLSKIWISLSVYESGSVAKLIGGAHSTY